MITDKSRYGHDAVLDLNCGDSVQVLRTEPMTLTEQEQKIVQKYLGIALLEKSYIDANGHLMVVLSDGRTLDVGSARGLSGATPYLGENGNWFVEGVDTLQSARGLPGFTPYIGENEHWWIDETDTGIPARGIPLTEKADNTRFLRNDGTWQKVTPENIGAAKQSDFAAQKSIVTDHTTRIEALEQRTVTAPYYTDDSVAYIKEVPENALPFASVDMVGGMTRECNQLWDEQWTTGYYDTTNGNFTNSSTFFASKNKIKVSPNTTYYMTCAIERRLVFYDIDQNYISGVEYNDNSVFTTPDGCYYMTFSLWSTYGDVYKNDIMLNEGTEPLPYEPYFDGLHSAPVTEVESVGANLFDTGVFYDAEFYGVKFVNNGDGSLTATGTNRLTEVSNHQAVLKVLLRAGTYTMQGARGENSYIVTAYRKSGVTNYFTGNGKFTIEADQNVLLYWQIKASVTVADTIRPMLNKGSTALPYTPYRRNNLPIPAAVQALDGYGWGVNDKVYNYIDWEKKRFVKRVGKTVFKGDENWVMETTPAYGSGFFKVNANFGAIYTGKNKISSHYKQNDSSWVNLQHDEFDIVDTMIGVRDTRFSTADEFKTHLAEQYANGTPFTVYYELAEPVITDISDLLSDDNLIRVEGGGMVTPVNKHRYAVPSKITYARLTWQ